ncbi:hypothetical protein Ahy_B06g085537 [Arachis hypogaea]|uniref:CCHC-type domain-containing protein n=1 Tax=Arachis hypogaea TaxID=3818 RepID=A0A444YUU9_ARAHY|nr:hypothetical protein Ahy_B06g085537 [Arachis hypogaea]
MRGAYVRGGTSRSHDPRERRREGESSLRNLKKVRKTGEAEEYSGEMALTPRVEEWMMETEVEHQEQGRQEAQGEENSNKEQESRVGGVPHSFAEIVRMGKNAANEVGDQNIEKMATDEAVEEPEDGNEDESDIIVKKMPNGLYNLVIGEEVKRELRKEWWDTLIVKLLGRKISLLAMKRRLEVMWGKRGSIDVIDLGNEFLLVKFYNSEDLDFALMEGPWKILDYYLSVRMWKPDFNPMNTSIDNIAAWIRLPGLAIEYYCRPILEKIGNIVGRTIKVDTNTAKITREKFARLCVEVDLQQPLVSQYQINGQTHVVEYEGIHLVCFRCGRVGHDKAKCKEGKQDPSPEQQIQKEVQATNTEVEEEDRNGNKNIDKGKKVIEEPADSFGPWMIVQRSMRGKKTTKSGEGTSSGGGGKEKEKERKIESEGRQSRFAVLAEEEPERNEESNPKATAGISNEPQSEKDKGMSSTPSHKKNNLDLPKPVNPTHMSTTRPKSPNTRAHKQAQIANTPEKNTVQHQQINSNNPVSQPEHQLDKNPHAMTQTCNTPNSSSVQPNDFILNNPDHPPHF